MRFLIAPNNLRKDALIFASKTIQYLGEKGQHTYVLPETFKKLSPNRSIAKVWNATDDVDIIVTIGGDGTVLKNIRLINRYSIPIWGIKFGHFGYLTESESEDAFSGLDRILSGDYKIEERMMFKGVVMGNGAVKSLFTGLNEVVLHRGSLSRALKFDLSINGSYIQTFSADGLIVATPTGSTAYNLSAGGPILMPASDNLVITPICSHSSGNFSIVASGNDKIRIKMLYRDSEDCCCGQSPLLTADSCETYALTDMDEVEVTRAGQTLKMVKTQVSSFYRTLQKKLAESMQ